MTWAEAIACGVATFVLLTFLQLDLDWPTAILFGLICGMIAGSITAFVRR